MLRLSRRSERIAIYPDRVRVAGSPVASASLEQIPLLPGESSLEVVLSGHYVRYAVLPWSPNLASEREWGAFAEHTFTSSYGSAVAGWTIRISTAGRRRARVACAIESGILATLRQIPRVRSVRPSLMDAFNRRRAAFFRESGWLVLQEPGRLTMGLIADGDWKLISSRQVHGDWQSALPDHLDRTAAASGETACDRVVLDCQDAPPARLDRYRIAGPEPQSA